MTSSDPWTGTTWMVYVGGENLKPSDQTGQFTLTAIADPTTGATAYYAVTFTAGNMPACWKGLLLYPLGSVAFPPPSPLLPPWSTSTDALWTAATAAALAELNPTMSRLEGTLQAGSNSAALVLVRVGNATTQGKSLLAMKLTAAGVGGGLPREDGTGHGSNSP